MKKIVIVLIAVVMALGVAGYAGNSEAANNLIGTWNGTLAVAIPSQAFYLPDTDQKKCYEDEHGNNGYAEIPCAGTRQDGAYRINPMSFTDNGNGTVTDINTGLIWQKEDDGQTYNWYVATGTYDAYYNPTSSNACGSFGRLPSKRELASIFDFAIPWSAGLAIRAAYFPNTKEERYWTSTQSFDAAPGWMDAWFVSFGFGGGIHAMHTYQWGYVRCVNGGPAPGPALINNGNGTVTDSSTGLIWQRGQSGTVSWGSALSYCKGLHLDGRTSWRVPNIKELGSLIDDAMYPTIDTSIFPAALSSDYWSSTSYATSPQYAWGVFPGGGVSKVAGTLEQLGKIAAYLSVRCVRGGYLVPPSITVNTPNGGQKWKRATKHKIAWTSSRQGGTVTIKLMRGTVGYKTITSKAANTGAYTWTIPATLLAGSKYKIKIISNTTPTAFDQSNKVFTIY